MFRQIHKHPSECLPTLGFQYNDGGRGQYFEKHLCAEIPEDIQDCSVIAVSIATTFDEAVQSPALSYVSALRFLVNWNNRLKPWKWKQFYESEREFWIRRARQFFVEITTTGTPKYRNPIYGTDTNTYSSCLRRSGAYALVFGEPLETNTFCLCIANGKHLIDGYSVIEGMDRYDTAHVTAVQEGIVKGPTDISHGYFKVLHVWKRAW